MVAKQYMEKQLSRRDLLKASVVSGSSMMLPGCFNSSRSKPISQNIAEKASLPYHLQDYANLYKKSPRQAALKWFTEAKFGLFIHYGLYSLDGIHPFEQWRLKTPVKEYEKKMHRFTAEKFNAQAICDLALEAEMKYVNLVAKHCEGFCLWDTRQTAFNSVNAAAQRDLVAEMAEACSKRQLGLFIFYEHGFDWRHPHGPRKRDWPGPSITEIPYSPPEPTYAYGDAYDLNHYVEYVSAQIEELLTNYGPIAGIWLDGASVPASGDHRKFHLQMLYDKIHRLQPHALISYKWGITGTEDFYAPEKGQIKRVNDRSKPMEICEPLNAGWGHVKDAKHRAADWAIQRLREDRQAYANFLLNIGPLGDGSIHPQDIETLKAVGRHIRKHGFPGQE